MLFSTASMPARLPCSRPALPRISSSASGFFFCGIRLDPAVRRQRVCLETTKYVPRMFFQTSPLQHITALRHDKRGIQLGGGRLPVAYASLHCTNLKALLL